ncbi:MAG: ABC transporter ATP-binding protein [Rhodomicrobium sp.]
MISLQGICKRFANGVLALDGVNFRIPAEPQFLSIVGPSGSGKTTLLRLLAGLESPGEGEIEWGLNGGRPHLAYVFQEPALMPWATVYENVYLPLRIRGVSRSEATPKIMQLLSRTGLDDFASAYPRQLSGGMRMRASVARALATDPRLLLMDEPFAALDEITRGKLERDLLNLWQESKLTVIFVTHSVFEAVFLAGRVAVMTPRPGRIAADLTINLPYPRTESLRTSAAYIDCCREVSEALAHAMAGQP